MWRIIFVELGWITAISLGRGLAEVLEQMDWNRRNPNATARPAKGRTTRQPRRR